MKPRRFLLSLISAAVVLSSMPLTSCSDEEKTGEILTNAFRSAKTLSDNQYLHQYAARDGFSGYLPGNNGYSIFIDENTNTCNFTGEEFMMFLNFAESLPTAYEDLKKFTENMYREDDIHYAARQTISQKYFIRTFSPISLNFFSFYIIIYMILFSGVSHVQNWFRQQ